MALGLKEIGPDTLAEGARLVGQEAAGRQDSASGAKSGLGVPVSKGSPRIQLAFLKMASASAQG